MLEFHPLSVLVESFRCLGLLLVDGHPPHCPLCAGECLPKFFGLDYRERAVNIDDTLADCAVCGGELIDWEGEGDCDEGHWRYYPGWVCTGKPTAGPVRQ